MVMVGDRRYFAANRIWFVPGITLLRKYEIALITNMCEAYMKNELSASPETVPLPSLTIIAARLIIAITPTIWKSRTIYCADQWRPNVTNKTNNNAIAVKYDRGPVFLNDSTIPLEKIE